MSAWNDSDSESIRTRDFRCLRTGYSLKYLLLGNLFVVCDFDRTRVAKINHILIVLNRHSIVKLEFLILNSPTLELTVFVQFKYVQYFVIPTTIRLCEVELAWLAKSQHCLDALHAHVVHKLTGDLEFENVERLHEPKELRHGPITSN